MTDEAVVYYTIKMGTVTRLGVWLFVADFMSGKASLNYLKLAFR